jgi:hypothetical protein
MFVLYGYCEWGKEGMSFRVQWERGARVAVLACTVEHNVQDYATYHALHSRV